MDAASDAQECSGWLLGGTDALITQAVRGGGGVMSKTFFVGRWGGWVDGCSDQRAVVVLVDGGHL